MKKNRVIIILIFLLFGISCSSQLLPKRIVNNNLKFRLKSVQDTLGFEYLLIDNFYKVLNLKATNEFEAIISEHDFRKGIYRNVDSNKFLFKLTGYESDINNCDLIPPIRWDLPEDLKKRNDSIMALPENALSRNLNERIEAIFLNILNDTVTISLTDSTMLMKSKKIGLRFVIDSTKCLN